MSQDNNVAGVDSFPFLAGGERLSSLIEIDVIEFSKGFPAAQTKYLIEMPREINIISFLRLCRRRRRNVLSRRRTHHPVSTRSLRIPVNRIGKIDGTPD